MHLQLRQLCIGLAIAAAGLAGTAPASAASNYSGYVQDSGVTWCQGAYGRSSSSNAFMQVQAPTIYAYNQHPGREDHQITWTRGYLYRWIASTASYQPVYVGGNPVATEWLRRDVIDGDGKSLYLSDIRMMPSVGNLKPPVDGYYKVLFDIRWDVSGTVTVGAGSRTLWSDSLAWSGAGWTPRDWCEYIPREVPIVFPPIV